MSYSYEVKYEIWNDKTGECIEIGPDRDGLELIEIRLRLDNKITTRMVFTSEEAILITKALTNCVADLEK